jgi:hypothetical protein
MRRITKWLRAATIETRHQTRDSGLISSISTPPNPGQPRASIRPRAVHLDHGLARRCVPQRR